MTLFCLISTLHLVSLSGLSLVDFDYWYFDSAPLTDVALATVIYLFAFCVFFGINRDHGNCDFCNANKILAYRSALNVIRSSEFSWLGGRSFSFASQSWPCGCGGSFQSEANRTAHCCSEWDPYTLDLCSSGPAPPGVDILVTC